MILTKDHIALLNAIEELSPTNSMVRTLELSNRLKMPSAKIEALGLQLVEGQKLEKGRTINYTTFRIKR